MPTSDGVAKILRIDLTNETANVEAAKEIFDQWLGGSGVATYLISEELKKGKCPSPLLPEAPIVFATGGLSSYFPMFTKTVMMFRSPLNYGLGESHAGGRLAFCMRLSDIDAIIITGRANRLTWIDIDNKNVTFNNAKPLAGLSTYATYRVIREHRKGTHKSSITRIGEAGEKLIPYANLTVDQFRHFGRLGSGAVFGSKNLKAMVISGSYSHAIPTANSDEYMKIYKEIFSQCETKAMSKYHDLGTAINVEPLSQIGGLPTRNFTQGFFEGAKLIGGQRFAEDFLGYKTACVHCPVGCIHVANLRQSFGDEHEVETVSVAYDHELVYALGSTLSIDSIPNILRLIHRVERYGLDAITVGGTLGWATDAFLAGLITEQDTDGIRLSFGNAENYLKMIDNIVEGKTPFYEALQKGSEHAANIYGGKEFAICFGGLESAGYMTGRDAFVGFSMSPRNSHLENAGYSFDQKALAKGIPPQDEVSAMVEEADWRNVLNSLAICLFARGIFSKELVMRCLSVYGHNWSDQQLMALGRKIHCLKFDVKQKLGWSLNNMRIPDRLFKVVTSRGIVSREEIIEMMYIYWDLVKMG